MEDYVNHVLEARKIHVAEMENAMEQEQEKELASANVLQDTKAICAMNVKMDFMKAVKMTNLNVKRVTYHVKTYAGREGPKDVMNASLAGQRMRSWVAKISTSV